MSWIFLSTRTDSGMTTCENVVLPTEAQHMASEKTRPETRQPAPRPIPLGARDEIPVVTDELGVPPEDHRLEVAASAALKEREELEELARKPLILWF